MIEIKAKTRGDETVLDIHMSGSDEEIGLELALIVTKVPQELLERPRSVPRYALQDGGNRGENRERTDRTERKRGGTQCQMQLTSGKSWA